MSPRGVAIPEVKEQLFRAAERVLFRDGPDGLTSRAITFEAGVAKGLLYSHFRDLDEFLAALILDRARRAAEEAARLPTLAGTGTVSGNLTDAAVSALESNAFTIAHLVMSRPSLMGRVHAAAGGPPTALHDIERAFAAYLDAEGKLGRIAPDADTQTLALALIGIVHYLFLTHRTGSKDVRRRMRRVVDALITGRASGSSVEHKPRSKRASGKSGSASQRDHERVSTDQAARAIAAERLNAHQSVPPRVTPDE